MRAIHKYFNISHSQLKHFGINVDTAAAAVAADVAVVLNFIRFSI